MENFFEEKSYFFWLTKLWKPVGYLNVCYGSLTELLFDKLHISKLYKALASAF